MPPASSLKRAAIACALALTTIAVYAQVAGFDFINLDDPGYVANNAHVLDGVTAEGIVWAFTTTSQANWHPLTWLSHVRRPSPLRLGLAAVTHAASLLAKPMFVSFPVLLLLFDVWPLARRAPWRRLVAEKTPFIVLSAASCVVTLLVQSHGGATRTLIDSPFTTRALNAVVSYVRYLGQAMWPSGLAVYYQFPYDGVPAWKAAGAASPSAGRRFASRPACPTPSRASSADSSRSDASMKRPRELARGSQRAPTIRGAMSTPGSLR